MPKFNLYRKFFSLICILQAQRCSLSCVQFYLTDWQIGSLKGTRLDKCQSHTLKAQLHDMHTYVTLVIEKHPTPEFRRARVILGPWYGTCVPAEDFLKCVSDRQCIHTELKVWSGPGNVQHLTLNNIWLCRIRCHICLGIERVSNIVVSDIFIMADLCTMER